MTLDRKTLQAQLHSLGRDEFLHLIVDLFLDCADDTEDFENKEISENYRMAAMAIVNLIEDGST